MSMRAAVIKNGVVTNIIEVEALDVFPNLVIDDGAEIGDAWDGQKFSRPAQPAPTIAEYTEAVQAHLDARAQERNYDGILSACTYASSSNAKFKAEGQACVDWRDAVWAQCYARLTAVQQGQQAAPTVEGLIASLPALTWPAT
jgi:hypothetical protein